MIEKREEASKDAPTEEVKNNVNKIYNEVTSGGMFSSLTQGIRGIFSGRGAGASGNFAGQGSGNTAATTSSSSVGTSVNSRNNAPTARSFASSKKIGLGCSPYSLTDQWNNLMGIQREFLQLLNNEGPGSYIEAKPLLSKIRRSCENRQEVITLKYAYEVHKLVQIVLPFLRGFMQEIKRDPGVKNDLRFLKDWLTERIPQRSLDWDFWTNFF